MIPAPATLERRLGLPEALGISVAIISPSIGMAFNVVLVAQVAGPAAPLTFALGTLVMVVVALSFVAFSRRQSHAGAAYAFIAHAFGASAGVLAGWSTLLAYLCFCTGLALLVGSFLTAAAANAGIHLERFSLAFDMLAIFVSAVLAWRDVRLASRLMLALEGLSVAAIVVLAAVIFATIGDHGGWSLLPFSAQAAPGGWLSVGYGLVFALLSFAGFEGAATLAEETVEPERNIPAAMLGSVLGIGVMYVIVSYAVVLGFGVTHSVDLAHAAAPLDDLARRRIGPVFAAGLDICCAISAFSGALGSLSGAVRLLFALGRGGLSKSLAKIDRVHSTPARAVVVCALASALPLLLILQGMDPNDYYGDTGTIGTLAVILVYAGVTVGEAVEAASARRMGWVALGIAGTAMLGWALLCTVLPQQGSSGAIWVAFVLGWGALGGVLLVTRPRLRRWSGGA